MWNYREEGWKAKNTSDLPMYLHQQHSTTDLVCKDIVMNSCTYRPEEMQWDKARLLHRCSTPMSPWR